MKIELMKTYRFYDDGYWDSRGCSCCPAVFVDVYNSDDTDPNLGSAHSVEDCYVQSILTREVEIGIPYDEAKEYYYMELDSLKILAYAMGIDVIIEMNIEEEGEQ